MCGYHVTRRLERVRWLRALAALREDLGSVPSTHMAVYHSFLFVWFLFPFFFLTPALGHLTFSSGLHRQCRSDARIRIQAKQPYRYNNTFLMLKKKREKTRTLFQISGSTYKMQKRKARKTTQKSWHSLLEDWTVTRSALSGSWSHFRVQLKALAFYCGRKGSRSSQFLFCNFALLSSFPWELWTRVTLTSQLLLLFDQNSQCSVDWP